MASPDVKTLNRVFSALSDPTRRAIVRQLTKGESTVGQLGAPFDLAPATLSKHLRVLADAGLVRQTRDGRFLRTRLSPGPLWSSLGWLEELRLLWDEQLDNLEVLLRRERQRRQS
ncbi:MAG: metalloregulator ArsR/SmtB family transcription factor [Vicinamibacterales bacterium]